jgi:uncharacterized protein (DUF1499 family)
MMIKQLTSWHNMAMFHINRAKWTALLLMTATIILYQQFLLIAAHVGEQTEQRRWAVRLIHEPRQSYMSWIASAWVSSQTETTDPNIAESDVSSQTDSTEENESVEPEYITDRDAARGVLAELGLDLVDRLVIGDALGFYLVQAATTNADVLSAKATSNEVPPNQCLKNTEVNQGIRSWNQSDCDDSRNITSNRQSDRGECDVPARLRASKHVLWFEEQIHRPRTKRSLPSETKVTLRVDFNDLGMQSYLVRVSA